MKLILKTLIFSIGLVALKTNAIDADFNNVELSAFVEAVSRSTNINITNNIPLKGKVSLNRNNLSKEEYIEVFKNVLRVNGYSVQNVGGMFNIIEEKNKSIIYPENTGNDSYGELVTRSLQLNTIPVTEIITQLNALSGGKSDVSMSGMNSGNVLMMSGYASDVTRISELAKSLDQKHNRANDIIFLKYAVPDEMVKTIDGLLNNGDFGKGTLKTSVVPDNRTNSIIIYGSEENRIKVKALIKNLDKSKSYSFTDGVVYLRYTSADSIEKMIDKFNKSNSLTFKDISVVAVSEINAVVVSAPDEKKLEIISLIHQLDVRRAQVHVEAMIVELADGDGINFGVQWGDSSGSLMQFSNGSQIPLGVLKGAMQQSQPQKGSTIISDNGNTTINPDSGGDLTTLMGLLSNYNGAAFSIVRGNWMALVQAMKSSSKANILSTPSLTTLDNQSASFMVGENVPVLTGSTASSDNKTPFQTVDRKDVGTKLTILPQINDGEVVQLKISAEVSKVEGNTGLDVTFAERKLDTTVLINDGAMLVLGGLIDHQEDESYYKVPVLGDIPWIGALFSSHAKKTQKRNLMIFLRPTIIRDGVLANDVTQMKYRSLIDKKIIKDSDGNIGDYDLKIPSEIEAFQLSFQE